MSKSVRLADYLYAQVEELAAQEKRSLANMVQVLLEQALKMDHAPVTKVSPAPSGEMQSSTTPRNERVAASLNPDVKTDFK